MISPTSSVKSKRRTTVIIDHIIDTAGAMALAANALVEHGTRGVYACEVFKSKTSQAMTSGRSPDKERISNAHN